MSPTAEETFNQAVEWVTKEIKKEILAGPGELVSFNFKASSDNALPLIEDQRRAVKALLNCGAIKIVENIYPYPSYIISSMTFMGDLAPSGYVLEILQPNFDKISGQPQRIHELIKENASASPLDAPPQKTTNKQAANSIVWPQGFKWKDNDTFDLDGKGEIEFSPKEDNKTKTYFKMMADAKDWVKVIDMLEVTGENASQVRTKLNQIKAKIRNRGYSHLITVESKGDYSAGAYRLHPYPKNNV